MKILWILATLLCAISHMSDAQELTQTDRQVSSGKLAVYANFTSKYVPSRTVRVWMPEGYSNQQKYAVLYMHDGQMLFDANATWNKQEWQVDEIASRLINTEKTQPFIVVGIDNGGDSRHSEYFPAKAIAYIPVTESNKSDDFLTYQVRSDEYLSFLVNELKPFIDTHYSVHTEKEYTFVMGSSMGGLISMYAISEYPEVFGGAACISTHWLGIQPDAKLPVAEGFYGYMKAHLPAPSSHKLYFDHGTQTLDKFYPPLQREVDKIVKAKGYSTHNWQSLSFAGADHSELSWAKRLDIPLTFLLASPEYAKH